MKRVDLYLVPAEAERADFDGRQVVVVDVLRTCSSIATALHNGALKVIPVETVEEAKRIAGTLDPKLRLLCGERDGRKVGGFDLGNSPREYVRDRVEGATLVFASTNASPVMAGLLAGLEQRLLAYVNLGAIAEAVRRDGRDLAIVCAGRHGGFSLEDTACAGALLTRLLAAGLAPEWNDAAGFAAGFDRDYGRPAEAVLRKSDHGRYLVSLGFEEDLPVCSAIDSIPVVPHLREGRITIQAPPPA
ncbi:MAG TPA: 2-phosphosulfolactate phosphatase [Candidatus Eisenbacteria bacterium]|jgi:2-phosphosulfolactate phosphatase